MPDCIVDLSVVAGAFVLYQRAQNALDKKRRERHRVAARLAKQFLDRDLSRELSYSASAAAQLPLGADTSAAAALAVVQAYQDKCPAGSRAEPEPLIPSFSIGLFRCGGFGGQVGGPEVETTLCEELKSWLLSAATGAVPADEVAARTEFYRHILMRPETFIDAAFLGTMAVVCGHLDELQGRLQGAVRSCATLLSKVFSASRMFVEGLLPVLLLAMTDALEAGAVPLLSVEGLARSAVDAAARERGGGAPGDVLGSVWGTDFGRLLRELLFAPHLQEVWGFEIDRDSLRRASCRGVLDAWLELRHKWMDALDAGLPMDSSGLAEHFRGKERRDLQQVYLDVFKQLDNAVKFLSMLAHYKSLASLGGDVAMYHLRDRLHHLLQEIELAVIQVSHGASRIMAEVRGVVVDLAIREPRPVGRRRAWIERLQCIDEALVAQSFRALLEAMREVRCLSSEARLPALQSSCRRSLEKIAAVAASPEFRLRCAEAPPQGALPALPEVAAPPALQGESASSAAASSGAPAWSVERQLRRPEEGQAAGLRRDSTADLGDVVRGLNRGDLKAPGDVCLVHCAGTREQVALYRPSCEAAALEALGLGTPGAGADDGACTVICPSEAAVAAADAEVVAVDVARVSGSPASASPSGGAGAEAGRPGGEAAILGGPSGGPACGEAASAGAPTPAGALVAEGAAGGASTGRAEVGRAAAAAGASGPALGVAAWRGAEAGGGGRAVDAAEAEAFHGLLFSAVLPMLGDLDTELLTPLGVQALLARADLDAATSEAVMRLALGRGWAGIAEEACVDAGGLARACRLAAHAQLLAEGRPERPPTERDLRPVADSGAAPPCLVRLRGLRWDGRKVRVLEPLC